MPLSSWIRSFARSCKNGKFTKYNTTRRAIQFLQFVKGLRAGWYCLSGRIRPVGRRLPTPGIRNTGHCKILSSGSFHQIKCYCWKVRSWKNHSLRRRVATSWYFRDGQNACNLLLYLATKQVFENLGEGQLPGCSPGCGPGKTYLQGWKISPKNVCSNFVHLVGVCSNKLETLQSIVFTNIVAKPNSRNDVYLVGAISFKLICIMYEE